MPHANTPQGPFDAASPPAAKAERAGSGQAPGGRAAPEARPAGAPAEAGDEGAAGKSWAEPPRAAKGAATARNPAQRQRSLGARALAKLLDEDDDEDPAEGRVSKRAVQRQKSFSEGLAGLLATVEGEEQGAGQRGRPELADRRAIQQRKKLSRKPAGPEAGSRLGELLAEVEGGEGSRELREAARGVRKGDRESRVAPGPAAQPGCPPQGAAAPLVAPNASRQRSTLHMVPDPSQHRPTVPSASAPDSPQRRPGDESPTNSLSLLAIQHSPRGSEWGSSSKASTAHKWNMTSKMTKGELVLQEIEKAEIEESSNRFATRVSQFSVELDKRGKLLKHASTLGRLNHHVSAYGCVGKAVVSNQFDFAITIVVILNALLIGAQVQHNAVSDEEVLAFEMLEYGCTLVFTVELIARLAVHRQHFFTYAGERLWNVFDLFLVGLCLFDAALTLAFGAGNGDAGLVGKSLFWVLVIMVGLIYTISVVLTQGATEYIRDARAPVASDEYKQDGDQEITFEEFLQALENQEVRDYVSALEVEITDAKMFFQMLDRDGSGTVDILEFTSGMRKFRGEAKSVDIHMMLHQNRQLFKLVTALVGTLWEEYQDEDEQSL
ncbi:unnamed protein product [Prorocentrum cordatum]|uniref:EF-hand domain-containing protein n=1 Tax=Prorocentrum cordatum TaxID=2364126 RepID=A0ABN9TPV2_9DINO|nr:unnamed protein product [Polarella glacialis]